MSYADDAVLMAEDEMGIRCRLERMEMLRVKRVGIKYKEVKDYQVKKGGERF